MPETDSTSPFLTATFHVGGVAVIATSHDTAPAGPPPRHPNGAIKLDHVVMTAPDLEAAIAELQALGLQRIATLRASAGCGVPLAFMSKRIQ